MESIGLVAGVKSRINQLGSDPIGLFPRGTWRTVIDPVVKPQIVCRGVRLYAVADGASRAVPFAGAAFPVQGNRRPEPDFKESQRLDLAIGSIRPGDHLENRFEIEERIGVGGISLVNRAVDLNRCEEIVIKFLCPTLLQELKGVKNFVNEARIESLLNHPNIGKVYEVHVDPGVHFLQMELLKGKNLREWMKRASAKSANMTLRQSLAIPMNPSVLRTSASDEEGRVGLHGQRPKRSG